MLPEWAVILIVWAIFLPPIWYGIRFLTWIAFDFIFQARDQMYDGNGVERWKVFAFLPYLLLEIIAVSWAAFSIWCFFKNIQAAKQWLDK